jgi:hypothetical protein
MPSESISAFRVAFLSGSQVKKGLRKAVLFCTIKLWRKGYTVLDASMKDKSSGRKLDECF